MKNNDLFKHAQNIIIYLEFVRCLETTWKCNIIDKNNKNQIELKNLSKYMNKHGQ
jgi:hypothetical protein